MTEPYYSDESVALGETWQNGGEHETGPTWTLATSKPGPDRDSTPTTGRGNRG